jgi:dienelactone hydrolase
MVAEYFRLETRKLADGCLSDIKTLSDWTSRRETYRKQLLEMLGLDPLPERTELKSVVTGRVERDAFVVEKLHFQSRPGLYVTGNLYLPKKIEGRLPTILYVCGHGRVVKDGVSYGNKAHYQHHGAWFARNGYACLTIDTLQLGEIEGTHHGTYGVRKVGPDGKSKSAPFDQMWWWNSRGYTPAGVEAWNCVRALDYLETRPEVDPTRFGVTGRSGGGAYSWWIAAIDERIKVAVPVAGITDLENHVVDGCVEGHCDCMYMVNTYRWDYAQVAALMAPRPLLITNSDKDGIFPLDGVARLHRKVRDIYRLHDKANHLGLQISEGPHKDTQELQIAAFHWFNRFLKNDDPQIEMAATKFFEPEELKVFKELPSDQRNTTIHDIFVPKAVVPVPTDAAAWTAQRDALMTALQEKVFRAWPSEPAQLDLKPAFSTTRDGVQFSAFDFTSQEPFRLRLYVAHREGLKDFELMVLNALDERGWSDFLANYRAGFEGALKEELALPGAPPADAKGYESTQKMFKSFKWAMAYVAPRGVGPTAWNPSERKQSQIRRRFMLLGQTLDAMRVYDTRRAAEALRGIERLKSTPLWLQGERQMAAIALYASLFTLDVKRIDLHLLPTSHQSGPDFLNVQRYLDLPQVLALAAERSPVRVYQDGANWAYPQAVASALKWDAKQLVFRGKSSQ